MFWCNVLRLRFFHAILYGPGRLRFIGFDQKPLYFNSAYAGKTLAMRGTDEVAVKENIAASRERFTVMTTCLSWTEETVVKAAESDDPVATAAGTDLVATAAGGGPAMAVLFRVATEDAPRVRKTLQAKANILTQFAIKGSYRLAHVKGFLEWIMKPVATAADTVVVVLDWFAPHLDPEVDQLLHERGHSCLRIGGGLTPDVQVGDTHRHGPYTAEYRRLETEDAVEHLEQRPHSLPLCSRQVVLDRACAAWSMLFEKRSTHVAAPAAKPNLDLAAPAANSAEAPRIVMGRNEYEWKQNGILNALDGSEDHLLRRQVWPLWEKLGIPLLREQIREEVEEEFRSGRLTDWEEYQSLLEPYDDHEGMAEGWEDAWADVVEEAEEEAELPVETDDEMEAEAKAVADTTKEIAEEEMNFLESVVANGEEKDRWVIEDDVTPVEGAAAAASSADGSSGLGMAAAALPTAAKGVATAASNQSLEQQAREDLTKDLSDTNENALRTAARLMRGLGEMGVALRLDECLRRQAKKRKRTPSPTRVFLRAKELERKDKVQKEAGARRAEEIRLAEMELRLKIAKAEHEKAKTVGAVEQLKTKESLQKLHAEKASREEDRAAAKAREQMLRTEFCAWFLKVARTWWDTPGSKGKVDDAIPGLKSVVRKAKENPPVPWVSEGVATAAYICVNGLTPMLPKPKKKAPREIASESLAFAVYGGKHPSSATTAEQVCSRLDKLLDNSMYGYARLFRGKYMAENLMPRHKHVVDNCVFEAIWRYSRVLGPKLFPVGPREWPPDEAMWRQFESACLRKMHGGLAGSGGGCCGASSKGGSGSTSSKGGGGSTSSKGGGDSCPKSAGMKKVLSESSEKKGPGKSKSTDGSGGSGGSSGHKLIDGKDKSGHKGGGGSSSASSKAGGGSCLGPAKKKEGEKGSSSKGGGGSCHTSAGGKGGDSCLKKHGKGGSADPPADSEPKPAGEPATLADKWSELP